MSADLEIHPAALDEIRLAVGWYRERSQSAAAGFVAEIEDAIELIAERPMRWSSGKSGTRRFILRRFPFVVIYRVEGVRVQVVAIAHGRRRPGYWRDRL
jgi:plasmid stabilization system protein ParE